MSILTGRSLSATGLAVAVLLALVPTGHVAAQTAPSYESLLSRLNQMPATVQGVALAEAAEARVQQARALPNPTVSIEAVIERYGPEIHELAGRAKDMGSAAVFVALCNVALTWAVILVG